LRRPVRHFDEPNYSQSDRKKYGRQKGGVFIYDPVTTRVLLVQSRWEKWGAPKGTREDEDATIERCALRELQEESGITLEEGDLGKSFRIDRAHYFYVELPYADYGPTMGNFLTTVELDNDATGITWITKSCLETLIQKNAIDLNSHCKKLLTHFLKIQFNKKINLS